LRHWVALAAVALCGCSTERQVLELRRDRLLQVEQNALAIKQGVAQGSYDPTKYDIYVALDADVFSRALAGLKDTALEIEVSGRPLTLRVTALDSHFHAGSPEINLGVQAIDRRSGIKAALQLDSRIVIEGDPANPEQMIARIVATRIVPDVRWGPLSFTKAKFVKSLLTLEAARFTDKLPAMTLPLSSEFQFGGPARTVDSGQLNTGNGSWVRGNISYPGTLTTGRFAVKNVLFLNNGVHLFANVEGL
jgi:hypothetical protein